MDSHPWLGLVVDFVAEFGLEDDQEQEHHIPVLDRAMDALGVDRGTPRAALAALVHQVERAEFCSRERTRVARAEPIPIAQGSDGWRLELLPPKGAGAEPVLRAAVEVSEEDSRRFKLEWFLRLVTGSLCFWERTPGGEVAHVVLSSGVWRGLWALRGEEVPQKAPAVWGDPLLAEALREVERGLAQLLETGVSSLDRDVAWRMLEVLRRPAVQAAVGCMEQKERTDAK